MNRMSKASTILSFIGTAGVVITTALAIRDTPKALKLVEKAEHEKDDLLTKKEIVKAAAPAYIPTAIAGAATIVCILGANVLNKKSQASLASAYALLERSYAEYRKKVNEVYGDDAESTIIEKIVEEEEDFVNDDSDEMKLFFDYTTLKQFRAPMKDVIQKVELEGGMECYIITTPPEFMMD